MELTADKQKALAEVRKVMYERLEKFGFTVENVVERAQALLAESSKTSAK